MNYHYSSDIAGFSTYNPHHLAALGVIAILCAAIVWCGNRSKPRLRLWVGLVVVWLVVGYGIVFYLQQFLARSLSMQYSLPLELCNLSLIACGVSLLWKNALAAEIAYYWGLGGGLHALFTPELQWGFPSWSFILYFWGHGVTVLAVVFLIACKKFRPRRGSIVRMMVAVNLYALVVGAIDAVMDWNYGYLCAKPSTPSLLDYLGPWPWYVLWLEVIAWLTFLLLSIPFAWRQRAKSSRISADFAGNS